MKIARAPAPLPAGSTGSHTGRWPALAALAVILFVATWTGIALSDMAGRIAAIWLANAIVVAVALRAGRRDLVPLLVVALLANIAADLASGDALADALVLSLCNIAEIVLVVVPMLRLSRQVDFGSPKTLLAFYGLALGPAPAASALMAGAYLAAAKGVGFEASVAAWYMADALGLVILVPTLTSLRLRDFAAMFSRRQAGGTALVAFVMTAAIAINYFARDYPVAFLFFPAVLLMTFMRGFAGGALGLLAADAYLLAPLLTGASIRTLLAQRVSRPGHARPALRRRDELHGRGRRRGARASPPARTRNGRGARPCRGVARGSARRQGCGRDRQPHQIHVPGQYEPRTAHPAQRHHRLFRDHAERRCSAGWAMRAIATTPA